MQVSACGTMWPFRKKRSRQADTTAIIDEAIHFQPALDEFLGQIKTEPASLNECYMQLADILGMEPPAA